MQFQSLSYFVLLTIYLLINIFILEQEKLFCLSFFIFFLFLNLRLYFFFVVEFLMMERIVNFYESVHIFKSRRVELYKLFFFCLVYLNLFCNYLLIGVEVIE